jgi:thiamine biosynthesis protein ThiS
MREPMQLMVNGEMRAAGRGATVMSFLEALGFDPAKVAVERNRQIVSRSLYGETTLADGDQIEIVQFVGGG